MLTPTSIASAGSWFARTSIRSSSTVGDADPSADAKKRVNRVLDALVRNDLKLKVEMIDEGAVMDGLQQMANRIALGLVLAALIMAAALIMQAPTSFRLFGYAGWR